MNQLALIKLLLMQVSRAFPCASSSFLTRCFLIQDVQPASQQVHLIRLYFFFKRPFQSIVLFIHMLFGHLHYRASSSCGVLFVPMLRLRFHRAVS
uniref:Secreted protein n=1 Tax=Rhipicephalus appendiculatus TaxID=34631 RepID=A0A131YCC5_RHIAP